MFKLACMLGTTILFIIPSSQNFLEHHKHSGETSTQQTTLTSSPEPKKEDKAFIANVPFFQQLPELKRGCEVTSLAMMLRYAGASVDKMTLASEISYVPFHQNGVYGDPNEGFVGDMSAKFKPGYGVYHKPILKLARKYFPERALDLTGQNIQDIYTLVRLGSPVWVITNVTFKPLDESKFETWKTNSRELKITYYEHSAVIVGYDKDFVYVNDPLATQPNTAVPRTDFEAAWEQMGKQAIALVPK
ncbi:C39 family peptidase [Ectobacillus funiculus]|uniref:C39 family peptidase n=1 Tax=Ectobacillus funiculus TaxID=137993 RepID=A0ABV5WFK3_9BACI